MTIYPAITIWQPWATLIAIGAKPYEFRSWAPPSSLQNRRIAIHAGARPVRTQEVRELLARLSMVDGREIALVRDLALPLLERCLQTPRMLPLSSMLCIATLGRPIRDQQLMEALGERFNDSDRTGHTNFGWPLSDIEVLEPFQPARGWQGIWNWSAPPGVGAARG